MNNGTPFYKSVRIESSAKVLVVRLKTRPQKLVESPPVNLDTQATGYGILDLMQMSSMCPWYSKKQLRRIDRMRVRNCINSYGHRNIKRLSPFRAVPNNMEVVL